MSLLSLKFDAPYYLILPFILLPLFVWLKHIIRQRQKIPYPPLQYQKGKKLPKFFYIFTSFFEILLIVLVCVSLASPYHSYELVSVEEEGIDILLAVDISASMQATDFTPNRLEVTKKILSEFIQRSGGHRIGVVVFGRKVFTLSSLTTDYEVLSQLVQEISLESINHNLSGGTAIGDALLYATDLLESVKQPKRDQIIILLSDGENESGIDPQLAAKYTTAKGIRIYAISVGSDEKIHVVPYPDYPDWSFHTQPSGETLQNITKVSQGKYYKAKEEHVLSEIFENISQLEQSALKVDHFKRKKSLRYLINPVLAVLFVVMILLRVFLLRRPLK